MQKLAERIAQNSNFDAELIHLVSKLNEQLQASNGKKVYRYLKPEVKRTVNTIFAKLAENKSIQRMYALWCEMEQQKHDVYSSARVDFPSLVDNKEFKSVKNMIVQTVMQMQPPNLSRRNRNFSMKQFHLTSLWMICNPKILRKNIRISSA